MRFKVTYGSPVRYYLDGAEVPKTAYEKESRRHTSLLKAAGQSLEDALKEGGFRGHFQTPTCWPMYSDSLAPSTARQAQALRDRNKKHGITGVEYVLDRDGNWRAKIDNIGAHRDILALEGVHNNYEGYGDGHAGQSPLYREDEEPFDDTPLGVGIVGEDGKVYYS